jgi:purine-binding chemotaxis protein CheW
MVQLARPPALPLPLEGILNLGGRSVPVLRLDRLLQLPEQLLGLYSMLIVLKGIPGGRIALLVDRVSEVLAVPASALLPVGDDHSFNGCVEAVTSVRGEMINLLSPTRILLTKERQILSEFQAMAQERLVRWEPEAQ